MKYIRATKEYKKDIYQLVQQTITTIYPQYYPNEIVNFFSKLHSEESIVRDIDEGNVGVLLCNENVVGTGSYKDNHITRIYVLPDFQKCGCGSFIMQCIEQEIALRFDTVYLDASLPASCLYERRGYKTVQHKRWEVKNGVVLVYEIMEKELNLK